jgi:hypothetical protein
MMQIEINDANGTTVTIKQINEINTIEDYINCLIVPALLGLGFSNELIGKYIMSDILGTEIELD